MRGEVGIKGGRDGWREGMREIERRREGEGGRGTEGERDFILP